MSRGYRENEAFAYACPRTPQSPTSVTSSPTDSVVTPPSSLRQYSSALKAMMAQGMNAAVADMADMTREAERSFDKEFGYSDEDPIERHVRMHLTPPKRELSQAVVPDQQQQLEVEEVLIQPTTEVQRQEMDNPAPFRPGLIQFHRSHSSNSRLPLPSFGHSDGTSADSTPFGTGMDTPGSSWSESSFEAIKPEDMQSLYGTSRMYDMASLSRSSLGEDTLARSSVISTMSTMSTITSLSTASDASIRVARPSLLRPRPKPQADVDGRANYLGPPVGADDDWLSGRTVSEQMIAQAGLSCQRGRANRC